jgi:light-regulated signal transduction histidine kinase (bacteriophytochrome)
MDNESKEPGKTPSHPDRLTEQAWRSRVEDLETQLSQLASQLENSQVELDSLLYYLSHDLRAPLRGIDGYSQALFEDHADHLDAMGKAYLDYIRDSSGHLTRIIDGLLKLYRIGRAALEIQPVDLSELVAIHGRDYQLTHTERNLDLSISPGLVIQADPTLAELLIRNLLDNAFKFTSTHSTAKIVFTSYTLTGKQIFLLRDDGVGFDMAYKDELFRPFQRLHSQQEFKGIGIGLAIANKVIQRHNGQIWAEGELEKGATIYFTI